METLPSPLVFLSYASPDRDRVLEIHELLVANGINVWMDVIQLHAGQRWEFEIVRALDSADAAVLCISHNSVDRTGFVQREFRMVLEKLQDRPAGRIYAVPVLLDPDVPIPYEIKHLHVQTLASPKDEDALIRAVRAALDQRAEVREATQSEAEVEWTFGSMKEAWEGLPGYEAEISWPSYRSTRYPLVTHASDAIRAEMQLLLAQMRAVKLDQRPAWHSFAQEPYRRTNSLSVTWDDPVVRNRVLSQQATIHTYGAGAAHGNHPCRSWVFILDPLVPVESLASVFEDPDAALACLQSEARPRLLEELEAIVSSHGDDDRRYRNQQIEEGTVGWDAFTCFGFEESGLRLRFSPYQVAAYVYGSPSVLIPYSAIAPLFRRPYMDALGLEWYEYVQPERGELPSDDDLLDLLR